MARTASAASTLRTFAMASTVSGLLKPPWAHVVANTSAFGKSDGKREGKREGREGGVKSETCRLANFT